MPDKKLPVIAVVYDDTLIQFTVKKLINETQLVSRILSFSDGASALNYVHDNCKNIAELPDIILLDIHMPSMNGFTFLEKFDEIKKEVSKDIVIYVSSSTIADHEIKNILR